MSRVCIHDRVSKFWGVETSVGEGKSQYETLACMVIDWLCKYITENCMGWRTHPPVVVSDVAREDLGKLPLLLVEQLTETIAIHTHMHVTSCVPR